MKINYTAESLRSFEDRDEPAGYVSLGERNVLDQRRADAAVKASTRIRKATVVQKATATRAKTTTARRTESAHGVRRKTR